MKYLPSAILLLLAVMIPSAACLAAGAQPGQAPRDEPLVMVQAVYAHFLGQTPPMGDFDLLRPMAAPELLALIQQEEQCQARGEEPCKYWGSAIVDGQDVDLADFQAAETLTREDVREVTVTFTNFGHPSELVWIFVPQDGQWRLQDIRSQGDSSWSLVEILR